MPFNWNEMTKEKYDEFKKTLPKRDKMMADFIIKTVDEIIESEQTRKKALVIMNYRHAFNDYDYNDGRNRDNMARYLFEKYPGKVSNVMINSVAILPGSTDPNPITATIQGGKWDAAFKFAGNPSIGFDFKNSPFGKDTFDFYPMHDKAPTYQDIFTGFVFYKPLNEHRLIYGIPGLCEDGFDDILWERYKIIGITFDKKFKKSITSNEERIREFKYDNIEKYEASINKWLKGDPK
jgi:hypothetical protein